jgi:hypothetical protein
MKAIITAFVVTLFGLPLATMVAADPPHAAAKGEVMEFGIFELVGRQQTVANPNTLDGAERNASEARFSKQTERIPATPGIQFGFRYMLTGITEPKEAEFKMVIRHPPIKNDKGQVETEYSTPETLSVKRGQVSEVSGYSLDRPEELVPGMWTFEVWYHGQKLVAKSFTVYTPEEPEAAKK